MNKIISTIKKVPPLETAESECEALLWEARKNYLRECPAMIAETREVAHDAPRDDPRLRLEAIRTCVAVGQSLRMPAPPVAIDARQVHLSLADREFLSALGICEEEREDTLLIEETEDIVDVIAEEEMPPWERDTLS